MTEAENYLTSSATVSEIIDVVWSQSRMHNVFIFI